MQTSSTPFLIELARMTLWLFVLGAIFIPLEAVFAHSPKKTMRNGLFLDLAWYYVSGLSVLLLMSFPVALLTLTGSHLVPEVLPRTIGGFPTWLRFAIALFATEAGYYWGHRLSHENAWLWSFHSIHHSSEELDFLSNSRAHPVDMIFSRFCSLAPLYLLGLGSPDHISGSMLPVAVTLTALLWGFFIHSNVRWRYGIFEKVVATPPFHHWHHSAVQPMNRNYSTSLPILDILFGTFHLPRNDWPAGYGIHEPMPATLVGQLLHPFVDDAPEPYACENAGAEVHIESAAELEP